MKVSVMLEDTKIDLKHSGRTEFQKSAAEQQRFLEPSLCSFIKSNFRFISYVNAYKS